jgi:UPF0755 protein
MSSPQARRRIRIAGMLLRLVLYGLVCVIVIGIMLALAAFLLYDHAMQPRKPGPEAGVAIPEGATGDEIAALLVREGFLEHAGFFRLAMRFDPSRPVFKHGFYRIPRGLSARQLIEHLRKGPVSAFDPARIPDECRVTIPEGLTIAQMASRFADPHAFLAAATDPRYPEQLGVDAPTAEGFLMPNTYFFARKPEPREVVEAMIAQFESEYREVLAQFPDAAQQGLLELVTVASLVEEEARVDEERPLIAAVIRNRLVSGMPLNLDSTLQYALGKYGQRMLDEDKLVDSPYNTYLYPGLPPGPISNPGAASLKAAARPANVDYLYFVSNADGATHTFSSSLPEHNRAVARYRNEIRMQRKQVRKDTPHDQ